MAPKCYTIHQHSSTLLPANSSQLVVGVSHSPLAGRCKVKAITDIRSTQSFTYSQEAPIINATPSSYKHNSLQGTPLLIPEPKPTVDSVTNFCVYYTAPKINPQPQQCLGVNPIPFHQPKSSARMRPMAWRFPAPLTSAQPAEQSNARARRAEVSSPKGPAQ